MYTDLPSFEAEIQMLNRGTPACCEGTHCLVCPYEFQNYSHLHTLICPYSRPCMNRMKSITNFSTNFFLWLLILILIYSSLHRTFWACRYYIALKADNCRLASTEEEIYSNVFFQNITHTFKQNQVKIPLWWKYQNSTYQYTLHVINNKLEYIYTLNIYW